MSIYIMDGKAFQKTFIKKEDPDKILKARYVIVSSRIRTTDDTIKNVQKANRLLFPPRDILVDSGYMDREFFNREYRYCLRDAQSFLASVVMNAILKKKTFIFLCSESEWSVGYLEEIAKFIEEKFHYPVYNYMMYKKGKEKSRPFSKEKAIKACKKQQDEDKNKELHEAIRNKQKRKKILKKLSNKEMKTILQNIDAYVDGMSRKQMVWMIKNYLFDN